MERTLAYLLTMAWGAVPALAAFLCLRPLRLRRLSAAGLRSFPEREAALALLWMYCGAMAMVALLPRWVVWSVVDLLHGYPWNAGGNAFFQAGTVNLVPFRTFGFNGHSLYILAGNILLFVPFGVFFALLGRRASWGRALGLGLCITGFIECWQLLVGRAFDIDDLLLNTLGVLCGHWACLGLGRAAPALVNRFRAEPKTF